MAKKPEPPQPITWTIYKIAAKQGRQSRRYQTMGEYKQIFYDAVMEAGEQS